MPAKLQPGRVHNPWVLPKMNQAEIIKKRVREIAAQHSMGKTLREPSDEQKRKRIDEQKAAVERRLKERKS
jgi:hypothetical protein